jgi:hypothetical protein
MFGEGRLPVETMVWAEGMEDWAPANRVGGLLPQPTMPPPITQVAGPFGHIAPPVASGHAAFLYISVCRLIVMSILSFGFYEIYWIYKNWRYLKERDGLGIMPFWRGLFGIFFCHSLLMAIHGDRELNHVERPDFSPVILATVWMVLAVVKNLTGPVPGVAAVIISALIPSFLCFVPVQNYINSVNTKVSPSAPHSKWSAGQIICLIFGVLTWLGILLSIADHTGY